MQTIPTSVTCTGGGEGVAVGTGAGADRITIASVAPTAGTSGNFTTATRILSGGGNDTIVGSPLRDLIIAGDGSDTIDGGLGPDLIDGKQGIDTLTYAGRPASQPVFVKFESDPDNPSAQLLPSGSNGGAEGDYPHVENVIGTPGDDTMIGTPGDDTMIGYRDDGATWYPSSSANTFIGGAGNDRCVGGSGKDHAKQCEHKKSIP